MNLFYISFITTLLSFHLNAQNPGDFYFTILSPSNIYQSLAPGEFGTVAPGWGWDGTIPNDFFAQLVYAAPGTHDYHDFCDENAVDYTGKVVLVERGLCDFSQKAYNAQKQGAIAVIIRNFENGVLQMAPGDSAMAVTIPCIFISESTGGILITELLLGSKVIVGFTHTLHPITKISGTVVRDDNMDCLNSPGENVLQGWKIHTQGSNGYSNLNYSDVNGNYEMYVDTGIYEIQLIAPNTAWQTCPPINVTSMDYDTVQADLQAQAIMNCPVLSIDIEVPLLRRCFENNTYTIHYCNKGTVTAEAAYATIQFDELISIVNASLPYSELPNNTYEFPLGDLASDECGSFTVTTLVSCEAELSQTLCAFANIYPQVNCDDNGEIYSGPSVKVEGNCTGTEVIFQIENTGLADMDTPSDYTVYRNVQVLQTGSFQLLAGQSSVYHFPADGATYRLEAGQAAGYPEKSSPGSTIEACTNGTNNFETGYFNMLPPADYGAAYDEHCMMVIGSFDPNDKGPTPAGYGSEHFIERSTDIHYLIRFQNTGTDTAFKIIIRDTLSASFDISSLELGASSHEYEFSVFEDNILEFKFENIMLPDSNINETASHGFLTYQLKQKDGLPLGTVIKNSAAIYFDFNEPVLTNETYHTIGENFIGTTGIGPVNKNISLQVYPNPVSDHVIFNIPNEIFIEGRLELYNSTGQLVRLEKFREHMFEIKRKDLKAGPYYYKLTLDDQLSIAGLIQVVDRGE